MLLKKKTIKLTSDDGGKKTLDYKELLESCRKMDLACLIAFPVLFGLFIVVFCCVYV